MNVRRYLGPVLRRVPLLLPVVAALALTAATIAQAQTLWFQVLRGEVSVNVHRKPTPSATPTAAPCEAEGAVLSLSGETFVTGGGPFDLQIIVSNSGGNDALDVLLGLQTNGGEAFVDRIEFANGQIWQIDGAPSGTLYAVGAVSWSGQAVIDYTVYMLPAWLAAESPEAGITIDVTSARCAAPDVGPLLITLLRDIPATSTPTETATPTETPAETQTPEPTPPGDATPTPTPTPTDTPEATATPDGTTTPDATSTPASTNTPVPTSTPTPEPTSTPEPEDAGTPIPTATETPDIATETPAPGDTPTPEPSATSTSTTVPTSTPSGSRVSRSTPRPTNTAAATPTLVSEPAGVQSTPTLVSEALPSQDPPDVGSLPDTGSRRLFGGEGGRAWWAIVLAGMAVGLLGMGAALGRRLG